MRPVYLHLLLLLGEGTGTVTLVEEGPLLSPVLKWIRLNIEQKNLLHQLTLKLTVCKCKSSPGILSHHTKYWGMPVIEIQLNCFVLVLSQLNPSKQALNLVFLQRRICFSDFYEIIKLSHHLLICDFIIFNPPDSVYICHLESDLFFWNLLRIILIMLRRSG